MSNKPSWLDQLSRMVFPVAVVAIAGYGAWDLLLRDSFNLRPPAEACSTAIDNVAVFKPSADPEQPPQRVQAPPGLAIVVPAGEKRIIAVAVDNPEEKGVVHNWRAVYGQFGSRLTVDPESVYTAPLSLVNDTITIEVAKQGCTAATRTLDIAVIPSATAPLPDQPLPSPTLDPALPSLETVPAPVPSPTLSPTPDPFVVPSATP